MIYVSAILLGIFILALAGLCALFMSGNQSQGEE